MLKLGYDCYSLYNVNVTQLHIYGDTMHATTERKEIPLEITVGQAC